MPEDTTDSYEGMGEEKAALAASTDKGSVEKQGLGARLKAALGGKKKNEGKEEQDKGPPPVPFLSLFRFTNRKEKFYMAIGCVAAAMHGALLPLWTILFGGVLEAFGSTEGKGLVDKIGGLSKWFIVLALVAFVTSFIQVRFQMMVATGVSIRIRKLYFKSLMRQDRSWYDSENSGELTSRVAGDVNIIQAGIGDKVGSAVQFVSVFCTARWTQRLTLGLTCVPLYTER